MNLYKAGKKAQMIILAILAKKLLKTIAALVVFQAILLEFFWSKRFTKRSSIFLTTRGLHTTSFILMNTFSGLYRLPGGSRGVSVAATCRNASSDNQEVLEVSSLAL